MKVQVADVGRVTRITDAGGTVVAACYTDHAGIIHSFMVEEAHRGKGIGKLLMLETMLSNALRGFKTIYLFVAEDNVIAQNLYLGLGWKWNDRTEYSYHKRMAFRLTKKQISILEKRRDDVAAKVALA